MKLVNKNEVKTGYILKEILDDKYLGLYKQLKDNPDPFDKANREFSKISSDITQELMDLYVNKKR